MPRCTRCFGDLSELAVFCPNCAQAHAPDFNQLLNQTVGERYRIYRRLGHGGLSTVFAATDLRADQVVVVKVSDPVQLVRREQSFAIEPEAARNYWAEMLERMRREAELLAAIRHPHIVHFYTTGLINPDLRYAVMELLRGQTLHAALDEQGALPIATALRIAQAIIAALAEVHARGIIHRDINPRNVMLCEEEGQEETRREEDKGQSNSPLSPLPLVPLPVQLRSTNVKLIDFGIAKFPQPAGAPPFTQHTVLSGTVAYAAPEQCQSRPLDHRADIYSLGVVLYEMLTGARPFTGRTPTEIALKQIQADPIAPRTLNPALPEFIEQAILRALAKDPAARQQSVDELGAELRNEARRIVIPLSSEEEEADGAWLPDARLIADEETIAEESLRSVRRQRRRAAVAAVVVLLALITTGSLFGRQWWLANRATNAENSLADTAPPTSTPNAPGSDADALELAARLSQEVNLANTMATSAALPTPTLAPSPSPTTAPLATTDDYTTAYPPVAKPPATPTSVPPRAQPQIPPAPAPTITVTRTPQPTSQPDLTQAPRRDSRADAPPIESRENEPPPPVIARTPERQERVESNRSHRNDRADRAPATIDKEDEDDNGRSNDRAPAARIGPQLIQWSGTVNRERVIKIELPGAPGTLEIPRLFRDRVGVVEPPSPDNGWRCAVLRVYGRGGTSIVVRWWPINGMTKFTARR